MAKSTNPIPAGFHTLTPHLTVRDAAAFIDFLKGAFGAVEIRRSPGPGGRVMHAEVQIGDSRLMLNDDFPEFGGGPLAQGRLPLTLHLFVPDADAAFNRAVAAGCQVAMPIGDQFWGDRYGQVRDPFGFLWSIGTHTEDLTPEEMKQRMAAMFGG